MNNKIMREVLFRRYAKHFNHRLYTQNVRGFTLVESMFVLLIMSLLIVMVLPSYQFISQKSQRTEGQVLLLEVQSHLERYYFQHQHYPKHLSDLRSYEADQIDSEHAYYQVTLEAEESCPPDRCYLLIAKHTNGQKNETLSLYSNGEKQGPW